MSGPTPGPWTFAEDGQGGGEIVGVIGGVECVVADLSSDEEFGVFTAADGRLIAASPDPLAAARNALGVYGAFRAVIADAPEVARSLPGLADCEAFCRAAIAKAEGR